MINQLNFFLNENNLMEASLIANQTISHHLPIKKNAKMPIEEHIIQ
jgi:hypothetical protein